MEELLLTLLEDEHEELLLTILEDEEHAEAKGKDRKG